MIVAMVASEMEPFAKTGGLADVLGALPKALAKRGVESHVFLPRYLGVKETAREVKIEQGVTVHFIDHEGYFKRRALYGESNGDYPDNLERFSFFCREVLQRMRNISLKPDILHAHDWQAALSVVYLTLQRATDPFFTKTQTLFTIHNLAYQGIFPKEQYPQLKLPWELFTINGLEFYDQINLLKGGLIFARCLTTVSPTYSKEIQDSEQGQRLEGVLRMRSSDLIGILNGIDEDLWNPSTDPHLPIRYDSRRLGEKGKLKALLQKEMGLPVNPRVFLLGMVTRLAGQKGLDLLLEALPTLRKLPLQLVILGSGDRQIKESLTQACSGYPGIRLRFGFDNPLAHRIYAGCDAFLMPSRYEPCGLGQMIAMRYGTVPLVRSTGGLNDTVKDLAVGSEGNGFTFGPYDPEALLKAIHRALDLYRNRSRWQAVQRRGMGADFSWDRSAQEYLRLYESLR